MYVLGIKKKKKIYIMYVFNKCDEYLRNICSNKYCGIKNKCIKLIKIYKVFEYMFFLY